MRMRRGTFCSAWGLFYHGSLLLHCFRLWVTTLTRHFSKAWVRATDPAMRYSPRPSSALIRRLVQSLGFSPNLTHNAFQPNSRHQELVLTPQIPFQMPLYGGIPELYPAIQTVVADPHSLPRTDQQSTMQAPPPPLYRPLAQSGLTPLAPQALEGALEDGLLGFDGYGPGEWFQFGSG
jgi:hypothetical protein